MYNVPNCRSSIILQAYTKEGCSLLLFVIDVKFDDKCLEAENPFFDNKYVTITTFIRPIHL